MMMERSKLRAVGIALLVVVVVPIVVEIDWFIGLDVMPDSKASDSQDMLSMFKSIGHSLRYEILLGFILVILWFVSQLASVSHKPGRSKLAQHEAMGSMQMSPPRKEHKRFEGRSGGGKDFDIDSPPTPVAQLGPISKIDSAKLCDGSWLVPQVMYMCRTQVQQPLALYRAALAAGLKLHDVPEQDCQQLFTALVTSALRTSQMEDAMRLLRDMRQHAPGSCASIFPSVAKLCTSKHLFAECLAAYDFMGEDPNFALTDKSIWSCLLFCAIETRACDRCIYIIDRLKACGAPSSKDYGNMIRFASLQGDCKLSLKYVQEMRDTNIDVDCVIYNTSLATCVTGGQLDLAKGLLEDMERTNGLADVITYNTLMKGFSRAGRMEECHDVFERLKLRNVVPSQVTYGILLDGFINENLLDRAVEVFNTMISSGGTMNTVLFTTLIKGFARAGNVGEAMKVYEQMRTGQNVTPDLITFSILIKANCDAYRLEEALKLLEAMAKLKLSPDEVVFNSLLAGCARLSNITLAKRLYSDMLASGIRPSSATFSILIRVFHQCKVLEEAVEMLKSEPKKHKVVPEARVFLQLIQSCIRERQGRRAVEVYEMLVEQSPPSAASHNAIFTTCVKINMFDTAAEILGMAASRRFRVDSRDADTLLDAAVRKRKMQAAQDVATSMKKLGFTVDQKHLAALTSVKGSA